MAWLDTNPPGSKDKSKKLYVYWYNKEKKRTVRRVTEYLNKYPDKTEAKEFLHKFNAELHTTKMIENFSWFNDDLLSKVFPKFINSRIVKPATINSYTYALNSFIQIVGNKPINRYTKQDSIDYIKKLKDLNKSANTIASYTKQLKTIWDWFVEEEIAARNIIKTESWKKTIVRTIPPEDLKKIFEHLRNEYKNTTFHIQKQKYFNQLKIIRILYLTGFRPGSLAALSWDDIRFDAGVIYYSNKKENKDAMFPIHQDLETELKSIKRVPGLVFPGMDKKIRFFSRLMKKLEMNYNVKMLRKTLATEASVKISITASQLLLDHEDSDVTKDHYIQAIIKDPALTHKAMDMLRNDINNKIKFVK